MRLVETRSNVFGCHGDKAKIRVLVFVVHDHVVESSAPQGENMDNGPFGIFQNLI